MVRPMDSLAAEVADDCQPLIVAEHFKTKLLTGSYQGEDTIRGALLAAEDCLVNSDSAMCDDSTE